VAGTGTDVGARVEPAQPGWLADARRQAAARAQELPLPRWDRTDASALDPAAFGPAVEAMVSLQLPPGAEEQGVVAGPIGTCALREPDLVRRALGRLVPADAGRFEAANLAAHQGYFLYVPDRVALTAPVEIVYRLPALARGQFHARTVVSLGALAEANVVQRLEGGPASGGGMLATEVVEADVGAGAHLRFVTLQAWGEGVAAFAARRAELARDAGVQWLIGELGSGLSRAGTTTVLRGDGGEARALLVFFGSGSQHLDLAATLQHWGARTDGLMLTKGVLRDRARAIYRGTSDIRHAAKGSNSQQKENVLHLSPGVRSDAIPALYIDESELQAGHAATTGKVDPEQLFYMHARGIPQREAERLIVHGFFAPLVERVPLAEARAALERLIDRKLDPVAPDPLLGGGAAGRGDGK
jgi:Fe-S cluster assembly protein SufD